MLTPPKKGEIGRLPVRNETAEGSFAVSKSGFVSEHEDANGIIAYQNRPCQPNFLGNPFLFKGFPHPAQDIAVRFV